MIWLCCSVCFSAASDGIGQSAHKTTHYEKLSQEPSDEEVDDDVVFMQEGATFHRNGFAASDIRSHIKSADKAVLAGLLQKGSVSSKRPVGTDFVEVKTARLRCCRRLFSRCCVAIILLILLIVLSSALAAVVFSNVRLHHFHKPSTEWRKEYRGMGI